MSIFSVFAQTRVVVVPLFVGEESTGGEESTAPTSKSVFITEALYNGDLGGPEGADAKCQEQADAAGSLVQGKRFMAWIADGLATDFQNNGRVFNRSEMPYVRVDGQMVAVNYNDLVEESFGGGPILQNPINITQKGLAAVPSQVGFMTGVTAHTGIDFNGRFITSDEPNDFKCQSWTSADSNIASSTFGRATNVDFVWTL